MKRIINQYKLGDMTVSYIEDSESGRCGMLLYPSVMEEEVSLEGDWQPDSLVQVKIVGDSYPVGFSHGHTMRNSRTVEKLRFVTQNSSMGNLTTIETVLESDDIRAVHRLVYRQGMPYVSIWTEITNLSSEPLMMEMLSSFSLCGLSPFGSAERMEDMILYRLRSKWSAEIPLPDTHTDWRILEHYSRSQVSVELITKDNRIYLKLSNMDELEAAAVMFERDQCP